MILTIPILILALLGLGGIALSLLVRRRRIRLTGPSCGGCGYNVSGLAAMTCPECGGDLRRVGILTPNTAARVRGPAAGIIVFTLIAFFVGMVTSAMVSSILPLRHSDSEQVKLTSPRSGAYRGVTLHAEGAGYLPRRSGLPVEIELTTNLAGPTAAPRMLFRPGGGYEYLAPGAPRIARSAGFEAAAVLEWMKASGIDVSNHSVAQEAASVAGEAHRLNRDSRRAFASEMMGSSSSMSSGGGSGAFRSQAHTQRVDARPPTWAPTAALVFWLAIWACGVRYLAVRHSHGRSRGDGVR